MGDKFRKYSIRNHNYIKPHKGHYMQYQLVLTGSYKSFRSKVNSKEKS